MHGCTNGPGGEAGKPVLVISKYLLVVTFYTDAGNGRSRGGERENGSVINGVASTTLTMPNMKPTVVILILILILILIVFVFLNSFVDVDDGSGFITGSELEKRS